jgi:hypothetical protein
MDDVGAVGMTDEAAMGYYLVKWLSEPYYTLQADTEGMAGMISAGTMVVEGVYELLIGTPLLMSGRCSK